MYTQPTLEVGAETPLRGVTFVVLDLETTGGAPDGDGITEVGAVKVRGGEVLGEFGTLVNPGGPIPPLVTYLTGITEAMVAVAPPIERVLPTLLEFIGTESVLVAHNAPFDTGFLKAACARHGYAWPRLRVLDTVTLARRLLPQDEVANHKLSTLATYLRTTAQPTHRALDDARATVEVLHALIGRLGGHRVFTLEETVEFVRDVSPERRRKRHLADGLPDGPGVYIFRDGTGRALYVGTSGSIRTRVRSYFTAAETRKRIAEMIHIAERVEAVECAHALEAQVRELRLIAAHQPPYNRRSKYPERAIWLKLTAEAFPRLSLVRAVKADGGHYLGPFGSRRVAEVAADAVHEVLPVRRCTQRLSPTRPSPTCALAELGRCAAPCTLAASVSDYAAVVAPFIALAAGDPSELVEALLARARTLGERGRYEEAARVRSRLSTLLRAAWRMQRLTSLTRLPLLVGARPAHGGGWEIAVVRHGRLVAAGTSGPAANPRITLAALLATAETLPAGGTGPTPHASAEETERVLDWLERPEVRLVECDGEWSYPVRAAARFTDLLRHLESAAST